MKRIEYLNDKISLTGGAYDSIGDLLNNNIYYMAPSATLANALPPLASMTTLVQSVPAATSSQSTPLNGESLQNMIGLSDLVYSSKDPSHALPQVNSIIKVNNVDYQVIATESGPSGYEGMVLYDQLSKAIIVVNRGTQSTSSFGTDAGMAFNTVNNQWQDALALARLAANDATTLQASAIYTDGHSLGGTLAQMQAAYFGWQGYTFNAYGAGEVYNQLGLAISPSASIKNYRTMFDLVSDASTQIGDTPITIETSYDAVVLDDFFSNKASTGMDLLFTLGMDHSLSNFHGSSDPTGDVLGTGNNVYTLAPGFANPVSRQRAALAQDIVSSFGELIHLGLEAGLGPFTSGDLTLQQSAQELQQFINNKSQSGIKAIVPSDPSLLSNALNPDASNNAYRASLSALSPVVLQGLDSSSYANASLWAPGQTTGLTKDYLEARNDMIQAMIAMAGQGQMEGGSATSSDANTYVYSDLGRSPGPMYTIDGKGGRTYDVIFSGATGSAMTASSGAYAEFFGGSGNDTLYGGTVGSTLQGGGGNDVYVIDGGGTGVDDILDTDGSGEVEWKFADGSIETLTGGSDQPGTPAWKSTDGRVTYTEDLGADGRTELEIQSGNKIVYVDDFTNGELGIHLNTAQPAPANASNLSGLTKTTYADHTEYQDTRNSGALPTDSLYGSNTTGGQFNIIEGEGHAAYISAGNGNNEVFAVDSRYSPVGMVFSSPTSVVIQGGSGNQLLVGMGNDGSHGNGNETIVGGDLGSDASAWTTIDGGGAFVNALLVGGSQNSLIFGGIGADTIMAGSETTGSKQPAPTTIAIAGVSYWAASSQTPQGGGSVTVTGEPNVTIPTFSDPGDFQINISLRQPDGSYAAPFGLLGSTSDSGKDDNGGWHLSSNPSWILPGSRLIGGNGRDYLIGNSGNDTLVGGTPADATPGVTDEVLVGGGGANLIYGGGGTEIIFADLSPGSDTDWANLDPQDADTIYGGTGQEYIYGSGGNDVIVGGSGNYTINAGNGNSYIATGTGNSNVVGGKGNDTIVAQGASQYIDMGSGNALVELANGISTIVGGTGNDTIAASGGSALITEGSGATTLMAGTNTGSDTIQSRSGSTVLELVDGLTESTLVVRDVNGDLVLSDPGFDTQITVSGYFNDASGVSVRFEDGTTWGATQILAASMAPRTDGGNDTLVGSNGNDSITAGYGDTSIVGTSGNNTLTGGAGNDTIEGGSGADTIEGGTGATQIDGGTGSETYVFNVGDGTEVIDEDATSAGTDKLQFGPGIGPSDVNFARGASSNDLLISFDSITGSTITVKNFFTTNKGQHQISTYKFADGTSLTRDDVLHPLVSILGTSGNDTLVGTSTNGNYFDGKGGSDVESGRSGNDTFVFDAGYGNLDVSEYYDKSKLSPPSGSVLELGAGITEASLHVTSGASTGLVLTDGISGDRISLGQELYFHDIPYFYHGIDTVQFADGTTLSRDQLVQIEIADATNGNDTLYGGLGAASFDGKGGNDYEQGNSGNDTFVFNARYGNDYIVEQYDGTNSKDSPTLKLGAGITASSLHVKVFEDNEGSLVITDGVKGDSIVLYQMLSQYDSDVLHNGISEIQFADGTTLSRSQLIRMETAGGTSGSDDLLGGADADYFDGKGGDDHEQGNGGSDTFVFDLGYGHLEINETYKNSDAPVLQLGSGISASELHASIIGENIIITDSVSGDQITLDYMSDFAADGVASLELSDGTTLTRAKIIALAMAGMNGMVGNDTINGTTGADLIDGKGGNDAVIGNGGNDTFVFNAGYGQLDIREQYSNGQAPVLQLGAGITTSHMTVTPNASGSGLVLTDGTSGDQITLENAIFDESTYGVQEVKFADGTTLTEAQLIQKETSIPGNGASITGGTGHDTLVADAANESLVGGTGAEVFDFKTGFGQDTLLANGKATSNTILFGPGIAVSDLSFSTDGSELTITDTKSTGADGQASSITLPGHFVNGQPVTDVGELLFSDGSAIAMSKINQSFPPPAPTPTPAPSPAPTTTLTAGASNTLTSDNGIDLLQANAGNDTLTGGSGTDTLESGVGNTQMNGGTGKETYLFNTGFGQDTVAANGAASGNTILFGAGITASNLSFSSDGSALTITATNSTGADGQASSITLPGHFVNGQPVTDVGTLVFSDGSTIAMSQVNQSFAAQTPAPSPAAATMSTMVAMAHAPDVGFKSLDGSGAQATGLHGGGHLHGAGVYGPALHETPATWEALAHRLDTLMSPANPSFAAQAPSPAATTLSTMVAMAHAPDVGFKSLDGSGTQATGPHGWGHLHGAGVYGPAIHEAPATWDAMARQINTLTHAMASYTGGNAGGETTIPIAPTAPVDVMLHVAA